MPMPYSHLSTSDSKTANFAFVPGSQKIFSLMVGPFSGRKYWLTVTLLITIAIIVFYQYRLNASMDYSIYYSLLKNVENGEDCHIPKIDPFDETIKKYLKPGRPLECKKLQPELTQIINGKILINLEELTKSGYSLETIKCRKRCFWRKDSNDITLDYSSWTNLNNGTAMICEFMEIACWKQFPPLRIYTNLHHWITPKKDIINPAKASTHPNIILFVLDSISASNWKRYLPKTLETLKNMYNSTIFEGFAKVGDNSFPNAAAFLTGKRVQTVGYENEMPSDMSDKFFDDWPIIWKDFKQQGYATYYAEDYPDYNLFKYLSNGFQKSPTDHYFRPFCYAQKAPMFALNWLTELGHDWLEQISIGDFDIASFFENESKFRQYSPRGLSLLRRIPTKRNCAAAGIPEDFCICQRETQISINDTRVQEAAKKVVAEVNRLLEPESDQCSTLFLDKIEHAQTFLPNVKIALDGNSGFYVMYRVAITVQPSNAFLEGTVRHLISNEKDYTIVGDINRINKYGNQSSCVNIPLLRKYCYCKNNV
uniref:Uncharacterized protein n=1 Tax=Panagrolaimus sp. PS1159 TaxID=55785 RepID=A0AC35G9T5_9BILA